MAAVKKRLPPDYVAILHALALRPTEWLSADDVGDFSARTKDNALDYLHRNGFVEKRPIPHAPRFGVKNEYRPTNVGRAIHESYAELHQRRVRKNEHDRQRRSAAKAAPAKSKPKPRARSAA